MPLLSGKKVVVPWDFSTMSQAALAKAAELVDGASLIHVVHVTQLPSVGDPGVTWGTLTDETMIQHCKEAFEKFRADKPQYSDVTFQTLIGDAGSKLAEYSKQQDAELVVISSHGRTGLSHLFLGSVAERVVRLAHCPVLVLRG